MRTGSKSTILGIGLAVILLFALALYLSLTASTGLPGQSFRTVTVEFKDVGGLRVGDDVRQASVRVGQVAEITYEDGHPRVRLQLEDEHAVFNDASAGIAARSALGQNFVALHPGTKEAGPLDANFIPIQHTTEPGSLDEILSTFDKPTRRATGSLLREVGGGLAGHNQDLADLAGNADELLVDLGTVTRAASSPEAGLAQLLGDARTLSGHLAGRDAELASLVTRLSTTLDAVAVDGGAPVESTLEKAPATLRSARTALKDLRQPLDDLGTAMTQVSPGAKALGESTPDLRGTLREALVPLEKVPGVAEAALPAVTSLDDVMVDARPLADRLEKTWDSAAKPASVLAPYSSEISRFFTYWSSANRFRDKSGHYLRIDLVVRPEAVTGITGLRDPLVHRNAYPAPEEAQSDRATTLLEGQ